MEQDAIRQDIREDSDYVQQVEESPAEKVQRAFEAIKEFAGITVELCGAWLWVTGDTYPHREEFKLAGFKFSRQKAAWYFAGVPCASKQSHSFGYIRKKYGRRLIKDDE